MNAVSIEIQECLANSSVQGLPKVAKQNSRPIRTLWLFIFVLGTVVSVIHFSHLLARYLERPVATTFSMEKRSQVMPNVIICTFTISISSLEALIIAKTNLTAAQVLRTKIKPILRNYSADGGSGRPNIRTTPLHFLMHCRINENDCSTSDSWQLIGDIGKHRCYQLITPAELTAQNPYTVDLYVFRDSAMESYGDMRHTLAEKLEHDPTIYLHLEASDAVCLRPSSGLKISPGLQYDVKLQMQKVIKRPLYEASVNVPKCTDSKPRVVSYCDSPKNLATQQSYQCFEDSRLCFDNRIQELAIRTCNETSIYHYDHYIANCPIVKKSSNATQCILKMLSDKQMLKRFALLCTPCEEDKWKPSVLTSSWPREELRWFFHKANPINLVNFQSRLKHLLQKEFGFVPTNSLFKIFNLSSDSDYHFVQEMYKCHFAHIILEIEQDVETMEEEMAFPLSSFMGEVGGLMGLWLGCSVISFLEPIELLLRLLVTVIKRRKSSRSEEELKN